MAIAAARSGDVDLAVEAGNAALDIPRQLVPSLLMVTSDLVTELRGRYENEATTWPLYFERIGALTRQGR